VERAFYSPLLRDQERDPREKVHSLRPESAALPVGQWKMTKRVDEKEKRRAGSRLNSDLPANTAFDTGAPVAEQDMNH
jgi:hypothetical protein